MDINEKPGVTFLVVDVTYINKTDVRILTQSYTDLNVKELFEHSMTNHGFLTKPVFVEFGEPILDAISGTKEKLERFFSVNEDRVCFQIQRMEFHDRGTVSFFGSLFGPLAPELQKLLNGQRVMFGTRMVFTDKPHVYSIDVIHDSKRLDFNNVGTPVYLGSVKNFISDEDDIEVEVVKNDDSQ